MRRFSRSIRFVWLCHLVFIGVCVLLPAEARAQPHPRLLLTQENLQRAITNIQGGQANDGSAAGSGAEVPASHGRAAPKQAVSGQRRSRHGRVGDPASVDVLG